MATSFFKETMDLIEKTKEEYTNAFKAELTKLKNFKFFIGRERFCYELLVDRQSNYWLVDSSMCNWYTAPIWLSQAEVRRQLINTLEAKNDVCAFPITTRISHLNFSTSGGIEAINIRLSTISESLQKAHDFYITPDTNLDFSFNQNNLVTYWYNWNCSFDPLIPIKTFNTESELNEYINSLPKQLMDIQNKMIGLVNESFKIE